MKWNLRRWAMAAALAFAASYLAVPAEAAKVTVDPPAEWPQVKSDIPADPAILFGTLPNGMRYLIRHNENPAHSVSIALRIGAGSINEVPEKSGIAHFIEHMTFRGSTHFADGEVVKLLQSLGAGMGIDTNAFTHADFTVYTSEFPNADAATLDKILTLTRDIASEVRFDPKAVDSERQVVLAEYRQGNSAARHAQLAASKARYGQRLTTALNPIGDSDTISAITADDLKDFYHTWYRPERTTLLIVGDVDAKALERAIKARFGDWKAKTRKPAAPVFNVPDPSTAPDFRFYSESGVPAYVQLSWVAPFDATPDSVARGKQTILRHIALSILNARLQAQAASPNPPFLGAQAYSSGQNRLVRLSTLTASVGSGDPQRAFSALRDSYMTVLRDGVSEDEVTRAEAGLRTYLSSLTALEKNLANSKWMDLFLGAMSYDSVIDSPEEDQILFEAAAKEITPEKVTMLLRDLYGTSSPLIFTATPAAIENGDSKFASAFAAPLETSGAVASAPVVWPYTDFGKPGKLNGEPKQIADLGVTFASFANGVRLTVKPSKFLPGQVLVTVNFGHGRYGLSRTVKAPRWALPGAFAGGGLAKISNADLPKALAGKQWTATMDMGSEAFELNGQTRTEDFLIEMQVMAAVLTDPAWRPEALEQARSSFIANYESAMTTAGGLFNENFWSVPHGSDARWLPSTAEEAKTTTLKEVKALIAPALRDGAIEVVVAGDITPEAVITAVGSTLGALPQRKIDTKPLPGNETMIATGGAPLVLRYESDGDRVVTMQAWKTQGYYQDVQTTRTLKVLERVLWQRLFDALRVRDGITYSPQAKSTASGHTPDWGFLAVFTDIPKDKIAAFYEATNQVVAELKNEDISAEELERARGPLLSEAEHDRQTNGFWRDMLSGAQTDPRLLDLIRDQIAQLKKVTPADIRKAAETFLTGPRAFRVLSVPKNFTVPELP